MRSAAMMTRKNVLIGTGAGVLAFLTACARNDAGTPRVSAGPAPVADVEQEWSYEGAEGPEHWGELDPGFASCSNGSAQSPVDVRGGSGTTARLAINYSPAEAGLSDTGHTTELRSAAPQSITVDGKPYAFKQMHFHAPSEHRLAGRAFPAEFHFVHQADDGGLAVVGVLATGGGSAADNSWEPFLRGLPAAKEADGGAVPAGVVDFRGLLPGTLEHFSYDGSLTTPPCSEKVRWLLLKTPVELSTEQLAALKAVHSGNNRPVQPLNGRKVLGAGN